MTSRENIKNTFQVFVDNDNLINVVITQGVNDVASNVAQAELIRDDLLNIFKTENDKKFNCLIDLLALGTSAHYPSPQARQIFSQLMENKRLLKIAVLAPSPLLRSIIQFIIILTNKKEKVEFFENKDTALNWLYQQ